MEELGHSYVIEDQNLVKLRDLLNLTSVLVCHLVVIINFHITTFVLLLFFQPHMKFHVKVQIDTGLIYSNRKLAS